MTPDYLHIIVATQILKVVTNHQCVKQYTISTATNGVGEQSGSEQTPRGWHSIRAKIGAGCPQNTVFIGRRPTGEIYNEALAKQHPNRDWILTRIMWLCGQEPGENRLGNVDTQRRYIYIHGCPDNATLGIQGSHGCIRMNNADIIELFDDLPVGISVLISEE